MKMKYYAILFLFLSFVKGIDAQFNSYKIVDTDVIEYYNNNSVITKPEQGEAFYGQDANYQGNKPSYTNNNDGTITDNVTGLIWQQEMVEKYSFEDAFHIADTMTLGGHNDWRVPTIKELYSLILYSGKTGTSESNAIPYINTDYFNQPFGDTESGERYIDAQTWSSTEYLSTTMNGNETVFGVNFVDGRIKGYPKYYPKTAQLKEMYFRMVRGNTEYGNNNFIDNGDGTISDLATGLMWQQADDGNTRNWEDALEYSENLQYAGYTDWRLPNAKELHSIVDYTRCPDITNSPAINALFTTTEINDPEGNPGQYPYFWTSTTHLDGATPESFAVYIAFGEAQGKMNEVLLDVHGAGAQRGDPKTGIPEDYPSFFGPQGDVRYVFNYVRCVRDIDGFNSINNDFEDRNVIRISPNPVNDKAVIYGLSNKSAIKAEIFNINGTTIKTEFIKAPIQEISFSGLESGIYIVSFDLGNEQVHRQIVKL